jgi:hypothetical protein
LAVGCSKEPVAQPTAATASVASVVAPPPPLPSSSSSAPAPSSAKKIDPISTWKGGMMITTRGKVSEMHSQRMGTSVPGKEEAEFRVDGEKYGNTVVHWKDAPKCSGLIEVTAKVIELHGHKPKPGELPSKAGEDYREFQLDVETARCVD